MNIQEIDQYIYSLNPTSYSHLLTKQSPLGDTYLKQQANHYIAIIEHYLSLWDKNSNLCIRIYINPYYDDMNILYLTKRIYIKLGYKVKMVENRFLEINIIK